ncbi:methyl-CpG-binding domain-containing protein 9 isoform X2 [Salvia miltiorrhiza]|uniref:methyl-CpG-binding domain-containing protein 9 isoform X2 n=1 Tax=Salvia miltiorrhiza TaxID=226208 RepID=UPI0025AC003D|nr:methyl-CpG-binding domain-containing protein 9 isoform X2 [Salvia miltiorrhiza]
MEAETSNAKGGAKMAFQIDLNEMPISSPREVADDAVLRSAGASSVCVVCRKGVPVGIVPDKVTGELRHERKCFRCLLRNDNAGGGDAGRFDINASPPREAEDGDVITVVAGRDGTGGGRVQAYVHSSFYSHHVNTSKLNPMLDGIGHDLPKTSSIAVDSPYSRFRGALLQKVHSDGILGTIHKESTFAARLRASHTPPEFPPASPNVLYLQTLREYIAERSGTLGEGWRVEFEFCDKEYKTSAVYIAPDGSRFRSMEDVAFHFGLSSRYHYSENDNVSTESASIRSGMKKESPVIMTAQNCRQRQKMSRASKNQGFLFSLGVKSCPEIIYNKSIREFGSSEHGDLHDSIHEGFPVQYHDFCLISAGNIDPRPSYHNANQIWPVGYRCSWHDRVTGSLFLCDVSDGGDSGPIFKVKRYPCTMQSIPVGSTILVKKKAAVCKSDGIEGLDDLATFQVVDDDSISTITLLNEETPPCLDNCLSTLKREEEVQNPQEDNSSNSNLEVPPQRTGNLVNDAAGLNDMIGEFQVEGRSISSVWEKVSQAFLYACREMYKQKGAIKFFCSHDVFGMNNDNLDGADSLSKYCYFEGLASIPPLVQNENELNKACEVLSAWLKQDRFGLNEDFVREILEQIPLVTACSEYEKLKDRNKNSGLQTVGSGFLQVEQKTNNTSETSKRSLLKLGEAEDTLKRDPCPPGKQLNRRLPSYLMGDALQVWELAWRFLEVLELGQPFTFQELESELVNPWLDSYPLDLRHETVETGDGASSSCEKVSQAGSASIGRCTGLLLAKILGSLLKLLVTELLSKAAVYVRPNLDAGESKSKRGRKKDLDWLAELKKTKLDMLPVNELTWHEIARRYILAVLSMDGNLDSAEVASRESGKVFHCLQGDGGVLCGSLTGIAALEGDAMVLADAMKEIYGSLKTKNDIVSLCQGESDANGAQTIEVNDGVIPEWAQVLEPVRKLPTNVGARIRNCIHEALTRNPPEWAKRELEHAISKEVYKGNASGPTKRAVISVLARVTSENPQQKAEKKEKVKIKTNMSDLITKQCRIVLRRAAVSDEDKVFCNLLGRIILNPNDTDDEGLLGYPAMVSRPLDFRTIDLRLAAGAYGGSHEAFVDDVREVWRNIHTAYGDRSELIDVAQNLSKKFEDLYEKEVLTLLQKMADISNVKDSSPDALKDRDDLLVQVCNSALPRAPWDEGICKVCGMDKDDDNVLLCDKCDSEYHRYCLDPPLLRIPEGNWYCPSCVTGQSLPCSTTYGSVSNQHRRKRNLGELSCKFLEELSRLAKLMEMKEHWEFTVEERIFFLKFLFDEALNSATVRDHMDHCASRAADLQNKLRSLTSELKIVKAKEDMFGLSAEKTNSGVFNIRGDLKSDASSSQHTNENIARGNPSEKLAGEKSQHEKIFVKAQPSGGPILQNETPIFIQQQQSDQGHANVLNNVQGSLFTTTQVLPGHNFSCSTSDHETEFVPPATVSSIHESGGHQRPNQADMLSSQGNSLKVCAVRNEITNLLDSIANIELELVKVSLRRDFLGRDCNGRVYWAFYYPGARPWIIACGDAASKERCPGDFVSIPDSDKWMYYESETEIEKLVGWLSENNVREKELKESISQFQANKLKDSEYTEDHILNRRDINNGGRKTLSADFLATKATNALEKKYGPCNRFEATAVLQNLVMGASQSGRMYRCECLELLWPSKDHCGSCHQSFSTSEELRQHAKENCKAASSGSKRSQTAEDITKRKKARNVASQEKRSTSISIPQRSTSEKQIDGCTSVEGYHADCPFNFEEIMTRFIVPSSVKDGVNDIGLIGSGGVPALLAGQPPYLSDTALALSLERTNEASSRPTDLRSRQQNTEPSDVMNNRGLKDLHRSSRSVENGLSDELSIVGRLKSILMSEKDQVTSVKDKSSLVAGLSKSTIIRESSSRPLVGRASEILRYLKINLLDMDAALPEDAFRKSRSSQDRRCAWRAFVKSAKSIYEMVQATIIFEDTIKSEYLRNDWWYWSSPSTAARITTLSALALRIYSLDAAISYGEPLPGTAMEVSEPSCAIDEEVHRSPTPKNPANPSSPTLQKTPEPDSSENPRTRSRTSKRRRDLNS